MEEIKKAYREKSKKHHPDLGGDEWAFRMVLRAYEILKTTSAIEQKETAFSYTANGSRFTPPWNAGEVDFDSTMGRNRAGFDPFAATEGPTVQGSSSEPLFTGEPLVIKSPPTLAEFQTVDVELVWIRFELASSLTEQPHDEPAATTLSVCMVISWPRNSLVQHAVEFPDAAEKLRHVIEMFEELRGGEQVLGSRSRIEDGQFVGWLSYPNVFQAEAGYQRLQDTLAPHDLRVSLRTRDEPLPMEWMNR